MRKEENVGRNCEIFFLGIYCLQVSMYIFLKSVFFTIRSHLSLPLGYSFLLSLLVIAVGFIWEGKKSSVNFSGVCLRSMD